MQFLPQIHTGNNVSALGGVSLGSQGSAMGNSFLDSLNSELAASGITPVVDVSVNTGPAPGFRSVDRDMGNKLDSDTINSIRNALKDRGLDETVLDGIEKPLTIARIKGRLASSSRTGEELTDEEYTLISGALAKMGLGQEDIEDIMGLMDAGDGYSAMQAINKRMLDTVVALNTSEVGALARGLELSTNVTRKMAGLFGEEKTLSFDKKGLDALFAFATKELADKKEKMELLRKEIAAAIDEALAARQKRNRTEPVADTRGSRQTERAETRMVNDLTSKGRNAITQPKSETDRLREEQESLAGGYHSDHDDNARESDLRKAAAQVFADGLNEKKRHGVEGGTSSARDSLSSLFSRLEAVSSMGLAPHGAQMPHNPMQPGSAAEHAALARRQDIFSQVEQGMLRQLADGSTKMTLRLDPADLGQVTLLLTVKNGEIRALIRAENPETTTTLTEQMAQLRASLEEQGLKVATLDVETQLQQDAARHQWSDPSQFNHEQELREQARFARLARIRRESGTALARDMQSNRQGEEISSPLEGLHLIA